MTDKQSKYIKIKKISDGRMDTIGLPVYEYFWVPVNNLTFEEEVWFMGYGFDEAAYQEEKLRQAKASLSHTHVHLDPFSTGGYYGSLWMGTEIAYDKYYTREQRQRDTHGMKNVKEVKKYFINKNEVDVSEFERVCCLVGCEL